jgi:hypothetical protein
MRDEGERLLRENVLKIKCDEKDLSPMPVGRR